MRTLGIAMLRHILFFLVLNIYSPILFGLNILVVIDFFPHPTRPFILNQITGLLDLGHNVTIYAVDGHRNVLIANDVYKYSLRKKTVYGDIPETNNFDIVYCFFGHLAPKFAQLKAQNNAKWKLVTAFHGYDATGIFAENPNIYDQLFKVGDLFLPVSFYFKDCLIEAGCLPEKITVHHVGIDCNFFDFKIRSKAKNDTYNIVTVGRLDPLKGYEYAISAVAQLIKKNIKINYTIVGIGKLKKKLENLIKFLDCEMNIKLVGLKSQEEIVDILHDADVFLLSSVTTEQHITEGIPTVLMEAMATGLPVISTDHAGIPELVKNGYSGFIVPERDSDTLAKKLEFLLQHHELWTLMGLAGRKYVEKEHSIGLLNNKLEKFFLN